ncbi:protein of unknown function [Streptomyces sp. KY75]|nr:protein of unknown function [Streptomyces sp. KY75]CAD5989918.1 protein of unknown function [Streptomyces sp. KY70]
MIPCRSTSTRQVQIRGVGHSRTPRGWPLVGWQVAADPVRESPPVQNPEAPKEQILPGISQAPVPHGRGHSGKQGGFVRAHAGTDWTLTDGESRHAPGRAGEALRLR